MARSVTLNFHLKVSAAPEQFLGDLLKLLAFQKHLAVLRSPKQLELQDYRITGNYKLTEKLLFIQQQFNWRFTATSLRHILPLAGIGTFGTEKLHVFRIGCVFLCLLT